MCKVIMNCNKTRFVHRFITLPSFIKSARPLRVLHPRNLRQQHFANSLFGKSKLFSTTTISKSKMANCGEGDANDFNINYEQLLQVQNDGNVLIIDVREQSEIQKTGALPGSIHIPMCEVANELTNRSSEAFTKKYKRELPSNDTKLVFSCMSGKRSSAVRDHMQKLGYKNAYNYTGGWSEWESKQKCS